MIIAKDQAQRARSVSPRKLHSQMYRKGKNGGVNDGLSCASHDGDRGISTELFPFISCPLAEFWIVEMAKKLGPEYRGVESSRSF